MRIFTIVPLLLVLVFSVAYITKPSEAECRFKAEREIKKQLESRMAGGFRLAFVERLAEKAIERGITVNDNLLFRTIDYTWDSETNNVGWAAFGNVKIKEKK